MYIQVCALYILPHCPGRPARPPPAPLRLLPWRWAAGRRGLLPPAPRCPAPPHPAALLCPRRPRPAPPRPVIRGAAAPRPCPDPPGVGPPEGAEGALGGRPRTSRSPAPCSPSHLFGFYFYLSDSVNHLYIAHHCLVIPHWSPTFLYRWK
ncbi:hypothetical protein E2C01_054720 [Portunus trituberculatus]|uniref:Uncharacterized protein n=1 Tax=Portunus trituberculatus TaxID=210409 RepID=A0A5B7GVR9_PORTR|nr:hypothetical protein [Portunus trituberculatus]